jgi:hypothetical protein
VIDGHTHQRLRADEVHAAVPGFLEAIVARANREATPRAGS